MPAVLLHVDAVTSETDENQRDSLLQDGLKSACPLHKNHDKTVEDLCTIENRKYSQSLRQNLLENFQEKQQERTGQ